MNENNGWKVWQKTVRSGKYAQHEDKMVIILNARKEFRLSNLCYLRLGKPSHVNILFNGNSLVGFRIANENDRDSYKCMKRSHLRDTSFGMISARGFVEANMIIPNDSKVRIYDATLETIDGRPGLIIDIKQTPVYMS